jgi:hypothetical protein
MANAKAEFLSHVGGRYVKCARIDYNPDFYGEGKVYLLFVDYNGEQCKKFLDSLDFNYNNGFGLQELCGTIWYEDGTWSDRYEYDGSECWKYHNCPPIPISLRLDSFK